MSDERVRSLLLIETDAGLEDLLRVNVEAMRDR